jgi:hypothetical protein
VERLRLTPQRLEREYLSHSTSTSIATIEIQVASLGETDEKGFGRVSCG